MPDEREDIYDDRPNCQKNDPTYLHKCQLDPLDLDPFIYDKYFLIEDLEGSNEFLIYDQNIEEYIGIYGNMCDLYLLTKYNPCPVLGEDPTKGWELPPIKIKGVFEATRETMKYGQFGRNTEDELIEITLHIGRTKKEIKKQLAEYDIIELDSSGEVDEEGLTRLGRQRLELQEGDIIRLYYNNIFYQIDGIKTEPEGIHLMRKLLYTCHCRPILVTNETLGYIQDTEAQENIIAENHINIDNAAERLIF